jgi:imidazolonepropionase-like amidohydrolase
MKRHIAMVIVTVGSVVATHSAAAQRGGGRGALTAYTRIDTSVVALTHARVIDGTGAAPKSDQTIVIRDGRIESIGPGTNVPAGVQAIDLTGKSVIPGLVMVHEHLYYPNGGGWYGNYDESFTRLYLAGGVTSMRTAGNVNGYTDIAIKQQIDAGRKPGPWIDATAPYLQGPGGVAGQMYLLKNADDTRRFVNFWADAGATSFKAYMDITRDELRAAIEEVHKRGLKITGHLCSITYREAAELGIDNLEHSFFVATDFAANKQPDLCPGQATGMQSIGSLDTAGAPFKDLVKLLIQKHVALTSTLTVFETFTPGRPMPPGLDVLTPQLKTNFERAHERASQNPHSVYAALFPKGMRLERAFVKAGGTLIAGTDPTGSGGVVPGYSDQRQIELLVEEGFTPLEAISIATLNGARYLGRDARIGSIALGKQADLVVIAGNPSTTIGDIRRVDTVFKQGVGFDPAKLIASVSGQVGIY